jgi:uncharacterized 2Fe-2S/4Fe-4S cluster protein (DUF4445 family)
VDKDKTVTISVLRGSESIEVSLNGQTDLLNALRHAGTMAPPAPCAGRGRCGMCRVVLESPGSVTSADLHEDERRLLTESEIAGGVRLACRLPVSGGMRVRLPEHAASRIETRAEGEDVELDPILTKRTVVLPPGSLEDQRSAAARLEEVLGLESGSLPTRMARLLPSIPDGTSPITVVMDDGRPVAMDVGKDSSGELWCAAVDIGTTTVAMYLVNLADGKVAGSEAALNRQGTFGADVISRLERARDGEDGARQLQKVIVDQIADMLTDLTREHRVAPEDVHLLAAAGNTAMIHLMAGWDSRGLGEAPFLPATLKCPPFPAREIGMSGFERLRVWPLPSLSAYVGADITGGLIASGMRDRDTTDLLLDIGTNGEMSLGGASGLVCCSTAAGPAFEGAHLSSGVGSIPGAVDHVDFIDSRMTYTTIDGAPPLGFCGSGVVDLVAFLVRSGLMDETGRLVESLDDVEGSDQFGTLSLEVQEGGTVLYWSVDEVAGKRVTFTQRDLREVQLAKAAIAAGVETLMAHAGISTDDIGTLWLAGGFGSYIRPESAAAIGLIPRSLAEKAKSLGNAAARGAILCLLSKTKSAEARAIAGEAKTIELSGRGDFQNAYIEGMMFPTDEFRGT